MLKHLFYVGSPLLDITAECSSQMIERYGLRRDDCVRASPKHKDLFSELLQNPSSQFVAGGSAQNSSRISKWILGDHGIVSFSGCVGKDEFAEKMKKELEKDGVKPLYVEHEVLPTGMCACLTCSGGQRSMCTDLGAAATYDAAHLHRTDIRQAMEQADVIFVVGYFLSHSPEVVEHIGRFCSSRQKIFAFSLSASYICESYSDRVMQCLRFADLIFGNYAEASALITKTSAKSNVTAEACAKWLANAPKENADRERVAVVSNGAESVTVCKAGYEPFACAVPSVKNIVDTIGCGDALAGGFLANFTLTGSVEEATKTGIRAASVITQTRGCSIPETPWSIL